jgi:hypothetical protein
MYMSLTVPDHEWKKGSAETQFQKRPNPQGPAGRLYGGPDSDNVLWAAFRATNRLRKGFFKETLAALEELAAPRSRRDSAEFESRPGHSSAVRLLWCDPRSGDAFGEVLIPLKLLVQ